ncbi:MAG: hypothetical protein U5R31_16665 [Acidimicrobiia bacterium]|nr:hypothetical protein [Acidimicrobiia bacterium]
MNEIRRLGKLVAIEGLDGSGKSTLTRSLADTLVQSGHAVLTVALPDSEAVAGADLDDIVRAVVADLLSGHTRLGFRSESVRPVS